MASPKKEASFAIESNSSPKSTFGEVTPWAEPAWYNSLASPYYNESHKRLRAAIRKYIDERIEPYHLDWEAAGEAPRDAAKEWGRSGFAFADVPIQYRPTEFREIAGIPVDKLDVFHFMVMMDETSRIEGGVMSSLAGATVIGGPP